MGPDPKERDYRRELLHIEEQIAELRRRADKIRDEWAESEAPVKSGDIIAFPHLWAGVESRPFLVTRVEPQGAADARGWRIFGHISVRKGEFSDVESWIYVEMDGPGLQILTQFN